MKVVSTVSKLKKYPLIEPIFKHAFKLLGQNYDKLLVNIDFVSKIKIHKINLEKRGVDKVTDVLSFPMLINVFKKQINEKTYPLDIDLDTGYIEVGDIIICTAKAKEQAKEYGHTMEREIYYLAVHGLLHILAYDHEKDEDKQVMRDMEEKILETFNVKR